PPLTSARPLVLWVPDRAAASCAVTTWCKTDRFGVMPNISSGRSTLPALPPPTVVTSTFIGSPPRGRRRPSRRRARTRRCRRGRGPIPLGGGGPAPGRPPRPRGCAGGPGGGRTCPARPPPAERPHAARLR